MKELTPDRASQRLCDIRFPTDNDVTSMTHVNFGESAFTRARAIVLIIDPAFVYFHPTTFEVIPKDARDIPLYSQFTALKERKQCVPL
jgi:hypothetical protein